MTIWLEHGDMRTVLQRLHAEEAQVDAIVTDPPYELGFMGKKWDNSGIAFQPNTWRLCWDLLPPGGHLLAFSGTRTYHRMAVAIEEAGFEIRDQICWIYGQGFPKSLDVSKAIDKARDDTAAIVRVTSFMLAAAKAQNIGRADVDVHMDTSDMGGWWLTSLQHRCQCPKWDQWLKLKTLLGLSNEMDAEVWRLNGRKGTPGEAWQEAEIIGVDRRMNAPNGIVSVGRESVEVERQIKAANSDAAREWEGWGTALKPAMEPICVARKPLDGTVAANVLKHGAGALNIDGCRIGFANGADEQESKNKNQHGDFNSGPMTNKVFGEYNKDRENYNPPGRWPANVVHDGSEEVVRGFPDARSAGNYPSDTTGNGNAIYGARKGQQGQLYEDKGSASRFFYCAKANAKERMGFDHPTVKPIALLRWLVRMVTPPGGVVLDPFAGTGTMGAAAEAEGFDAILVEREAKYAGFIKERLPAALRTDHG